MTGLLLAAALALAPVLPAAGQETPPTPPVEPEAPATLLPLRIGDAGVELLLAGEWSARFAAAAGLLLVPGQDARALDGMPGIAPGIAFSQVPDLSLSLTLLERWFVEVSVLGGFADNALLMGYRGDGTEPVRHVLLGTRGIEAAATPFLETPAQADGSLGVSALVVSGAGANEAMLRWDVTGEQHRAYLGADELREERVGLAAWTRGRFFVLPDAEVDDLVVLLEDAAGSSTGSDGRRYRAAAASDVVQDAASGRVTLKREWPGRVLVHYTKGGLPVGHTDASMGVDALPDQTLGRRDLDKPRIKFDWSLAAYLGEDMADRQVTIAGVGDCLLLWEPGDPSPFQAANAYAFTLDPPADPARLRAYLDAKAAGAAPPQPVFFRFDPTLKVVSLLVDRDFRSQGRNWYPFWTSPADNPVNLLYGPGRDALAGLLDLELVVQALVPSDGYALGTDVIPSSVRVTVNGLEERRFTLDPSTGRLAFLVEIAPSDRVDLRWRTSGAAAGGGDVLLTWRDDVRLSERLDLWVAAGLRWNVGSGVTAGEPYGRSGALVAAAGLQGTAGRLSWSIQAAGSFSNPDTTGIARLHGMEGDSLPIELSEELARPAAPPSPLSPPPLAAFTAANRGRLVYRDHRSYDAFGGALLHEIGWTGAVDVPYATGGRPGPYLVLGSSAGASTGTSLVLDYELDAVGDWAGAQLPVAAGSFADLSGAKSLAIRMRSTAPGGSRVHVQIGSIGEDLDDDGVLDAEPSETSAGFAFDDPANAAVLKVGAGPTLQGNGLRDTEDLDGNGSLTPEDVARVVTWAPRAVGSTWQVYTFDLDDVDRGRLERARWIRIIVESEAVDSAGAVVIDRIATSGSAYWAEATAGTATAREVAEPLLGPGRDPGPGARLDDVQAEAMRRFHPAGEVQEVLEVAWSGTGGGDVVVTGRTAKRTGGIVYDEAVAYVRASGIAGVAPAIDFSLRDADGAGATWRLSAAALADGAWHEVRASRRGLGVTLDGVLQPGLATFSAGHGDLVELRVVVSGSTDGTLYLDEVHLAEPRSTFGAGLRAEASWSRPGAVWTPGGVPVLANLAASGQLSASTAGFTSLYGVPSAGADVTARTRLGADILYARLNADAALRVSDAGPAAGGGHRLTVPAASSPVTFSDSFSVAPSGEFSRADSLRVQPFDALAVSLEARASGTAQALQQTWTAGIDARPLPRLDLGLDLLLAQAATGYPLAAEWYGARWVREAALIAPWLDGDAFGRTERLGARIAGSAGAFDGTFTIEASAAGSDYAALSRRQEDRVDETWSLSWKAPGDAQDETVVSVKYARSLSLSGPRAAGEPFAAEAGAFLGRLGDQRWFLLGVPLLEIFRDDAAAILAAWDGLEEASWQPSLSITLERRYGSRLSDLFVPSSAELEVAREFQRAGDLPENRVSLRPRVVTHALNLFGRLGSHPLADFYRTDEYRIGLGAVVAGPLASALGLDELTLDLYAEFLGFRDRSLTLVNAFSLGADAASATNDLQATFAWTTRPAGGVRLPYLPAAVAATGYLEHRETLDLDLAFGQAPGHAMTLLLGHATRLRYPERGSVEAGVRAGLDLERIAGTLAVRFAVEASLEAKLTF